LQISTGDSSLLVDEPEKAVVLQISKFDHVRSFSTAMIMMTVAYSDGDRGSAIKNGSGRPAPARAGPASSCFGPQQDPAVKLFVCLFV
jgi:hypothetical protein